MPATTGVFSLPEAAFGARARRAIAAGCGAAAALGQPPFGLWPLLFIAAPLVFLLWRDAPRSAAFGLGWWFGAGFFALGMHWMVEPFLVEYEIWGWVAPIALFCAVAGFSLFPGAGFWLAKRFGPRTGAAAIAALTLGWGGMELARGFLLTGFPWALQTYVWTNTPVAQTGAIFGPYALSLLTIAAALSPAALAFGGVRRAWPAALGLGAVAAAWIWGVERMPEIAPVRDTVIRIVQPNLPQRTKWDVDKIREHFDLTLDLTRAPAAGGAPDVIVWPESAVTFPIDMAEEARKEIAIASGGADVVLGSLRPTDGPEGAFEPSAMWSNSVFIVTPDAELSTPYDKIHLVPFGEYFPFDAALQSVGISAIGSYGGGLSPGAAPLLMKPRKAPPFAPMICYEMVFAGETIDAAETGAEWMILATNDAWFGDWAGPEQHFAHAQWRAIETGLPIARAANTGISAMIDPYGRALKRQELATRGYTDHLLPKPIASTIYRQSRELWTMLFALALILITFLRYIPILGRS